MAYDADGDLIKVMFFIIFDPMEKKKPQWPYQNRSLEDMPGERWEDIPGCKGLYEISSLGRIKSLRRWRASGRNTGYYTVEKIIKQNVRRGKNHLLNEYTYTVCNTLKRDGKSISCSTSRYVYWAFIEAFNLEDKTQMISYKDCNGQNLHYPNLILTNRSDIQKRSFRSKRSQPNFFEHRLPVRQVTMEGEIVARYASLKEAEEKTGINFTAIAACIDGRIYQSHGFRWESPAKKKNLLPPDTNLKQFFNEYLWRMLGKPRMSRTSPIAVLNLHPENMKGERWKPVEGLEGAFLVSNFGRVKGQPRFKQGRTHVWTKGTVKRLIPDGKPDKLTSCLLVQLTKSGKKYQQSVARLVYCHFVKKINLDDKSIRIGYKNGKCYDVNWKNLFIK
jgi:hypothetical protein